MMETLLIMCMLAAGAAAALAAFFIKKIEPSSSSSSSPMSKLLLLPPGTMGWPFVGETLEFISHAYTSCPEAFVEKRRMLYGTKVFKTHLFGSPTIVSTDSEINRMILQGDTASFVPSYPRSLMELMGESSILLITGGLQRKLHGLIAGFFKSPVLKSQITADMRRYVEDSMSSWEDGQTIYIQDEAKQIAFQVLVKVLISMEPGKELQILKLQFTEFIAGLMSLPLKIPGSRLYRSLQAKKKMVDLVKDIVRRRRRSGSAEEYCNDVIDVLINDGSDELTDHLIAENMIDLMIPGEDSVPILITLAVKYLSDCPPALRQTEEENTQLKLISETKGRLLEWDDYMSLSFTQNVISESLRMGNVIAGIMRKAMRDVEVKGGKFMIPKGWCVLTYFRSVHLDADFYDQPFKFNPWRWQNKETPGGSNFFTPFGGGQKLCPGLDLARLEASIFLHHLLTTFRWVAEDDGVVNFPTVRMKKGMPIKVNRKGV